MWNAGHMTKLALKHHEYQGTEGPMGAGVELLITGKGWCVHRSEHFQDRARIQFPGNFVLLEVDRK